MRVSGQCETQSVKSRKCEGEWYKETQWLNRNHGTGVAGCKTCTTFHESADFVLKLRSGSVLHSKWKLSKRHVKLLQNQ
jgi:hypothetical protein